MDIEAPFIILIALVVAAALIYIWYLACREFSFIAAEKGWSERRYFRFCFWLGLVGMLMVIALPDRGDDSPTSTPTAPHSPEPEAASAPAAPSAPRRPAEQAAVVPVAFASERKPADAAPEAPAAAPDAASKKSFFSAKPRQAEAPAESPATWTCTCRAVNPIGATLCDSCRSTWYCACGKVNPRSGQLCASCRAWRCTCGMTNPASKGMCERCSAAKPR